MFHGDSYGQHYCWPPVTFWVSSTLDVHEVWYAADTIIITTIEALLCPDIYYTAPACPSSCAIHITGNTS